jgi:hypothetical protein
VDSDRSAQTEEVEVVRHIYMTLQTRELYSSLVVEVDLDKPLAVEMQ